MRPTTWGRTPLHGFPTKPFSVSRTVCHLTGRPEKSFRLGVPSMRPARGESVGGIFLTGPAPWDAAHGRSSPSSVSMIRGITRYVT